MPPTERRRNGDYHGFFIGNLIDEIDEQEVNVEVSNELIDFIYFK